MAEDKIEYGKRFAQTEELYQAHRMDKELEELARSDGALPEEEAPAPQPKPAEAPRPRRGEEVTRRTPIGALPMSSEPPPHDRFSELTEDAQRYAQMIREAVRDIGTASYRLARLPIEAALLAARRLRPARG